MSDNIGAGQSSAGEAGRTVRQVGEQARNAGEQAVDQAKDVARDAQARGSALAGDAAAEVKERVTAAVGSQKDDLAGRLQDLGEAVHRSGEQLEGHQDWIAGLVERGADELTSLANTLRTNDLRGLLGNLEDLARRQPALFVGASLAAGFALARVGRVAVAGASRADLPDMSGSSTETSHERK